MKHLVLAGLIGLLATGAFAHSPLKMTVPANEAIVAQAPQEITFDFKGKIRLTRVTLNHADQDGVDLDLSGHKGFLSEYIVPMNVTGSGEYRVDWRGLGADGHALKGTFSFTVE